MSYKLLCPGAVMDSSAIQYVTDSDTWHPKEAMGDFNPDTYCEYTGDLNDWELKIRVPSGVAAEQIGGIVLFIRNYASITQGLITVNGSETDSGYALRGSLNLLNTATPLRVISFGAAHDEQWWQIQFTLLAENPQVALAWVCREYEFSINPQHPILDTQIYHNRMSTAAGGRRMASLVRHDPAFDLQREYYLNGTTDRDKWLAAHKDSHGDGVPCVLWEGSVMADARLVRLPAALSMKETAFEFYELSLKYGGVPYLGASDYY